MNIGLSLFMGLVMRLQQRWFYLGIFWLMNFCLGSYYAWGAYASFLTAHYADLGTANVSASSLTYIFSTAATLCPITMIWAGYMTDRLGPRMVLFLGGALEALGYILMSMSTNAETLFWGFGVALGIGSGCCVISTTATAVKLFPERRGFAGGSVTAFYGMGSICVPILTSWLGNTIGIEATLQLYAAICLAVIWGGIVFVKVGPTNTKKSVMPKGDFNWRQMLKTHRFWVMFTTFVMGSIAAQMMFSQTVSIAQNQINLSVSAAVLSISVLALANTFARFTAGAISDAIGRVNTIIVALACSALGLLCLTLAGHGDQILFFAGLAGIGLCYGSCVGVFPGFTTEQFGVTNASLNYGIMTLAFAVAGIVGPNIIQWVVTGDNYDIGYFFAIGFSVIGIVTAYACRTFDLKRR